MICPICGLSEHPVIDSSITMPGARCVAWLKAELRRMELVIEQYRKACEAAMDTIKDGCPPGTLYTRKHGPVLVQIQQALDSAKRETH